MNKKNKTKVYSLVERIAYYEGRVQELIERLDMGDDVAYGLERAQSRLFDLVNEKRRIDQIRLAWEKYKREA